MSGQQRVLAIHDISGFGRCSLTVALPVLSAAGIECTVLPTAVLSTHTGGFTGYTFRDLSADILPIADHWKSLDLHFDAIYTGYLGSFEQIALIEAVLEELAGPDTLIVVDPVMGDKGKLYAGFPHDFPSGMANLCRRADVIVPNLTEAALMLNRPWTEDLAAIDVDNLLHDLSEQLAVARVVLTGVSQASGQLGASTYDAATDAASWYGSERIGGMYHGTGDVFSSVLVAGLVTGLSLAAASRVAVDFTVRALRRSFDNRTDPRFGVAFEYFLADLPTLLKSAQ
ncbi:MAG: pyridoxamine kinase [Actinomycetes bacterium]|jgi:pyridoxine kinase|nr:pyridoxamine kinase [Actinomycetes bacterium]